MTDCYATKRRNALDELGDYDCSCHPEIINAFAFAVKRLTNWVTQPAATAAAAARLLCLL